MAIDRKPWQRLLYEIWACLTEGHAFEVEELIVTENGTYTADEFKAYSPVTVDVAGGLQLGTTLNVMNVSEDDIEFTVATSDDMEDGNTVDLVSTTWIAPTYQMRIAAGLYLALDAEAVVKKVEGVPEVKTIVNPDATYDDDAMKFYLIPDTTTPFYYEVSW